MSATRSVGIWRSLNSKQVANVMTATARIDATAEIDPSYFPGGASVNLRLGPKRPANRSVSAGSVELAVVVGGVA